MTYEPDGPGMQHMRALDRANEIRLARAAIKREIRANPKRIIEVLVSVPECMESISLIELLTSQERWGAARADKFIARLHGPRGQRKLGDLTDRQRRIMAQRLTETGYQATMTEGK